jgi:hypothetical protein
VSRLAALALIFVAFGGFASADESAPVESARQMFDLFGIDESLFEIFVHGEPISEAEREPLAKTLFRLPEIKLVNVHRWIMRDINWQQLIDKPNNYQREFLHLQGTVQSVAVEQPVAEIQEKWGLDNYYRCDLLLTGGQPATVYARQIPEAWKKSDPSFPARCGADAVFLKLGPHANNNNPQLFFAANRLTWRPPALLGDLGMDYGLFDEVRDRSVITSAERETFFQLLATAGKADANQFKAARTAGTSEFVDLMERPELHRGELFSFRGVARRAIKIQVTDPEIVERFGFGHYFEVTLFMDLKGYLTLADRKVSTYPIVFCVRELPDGMPVGENISEAVTATGFMFKLWSYTTGIAGPSGQNASMNSPLLIGQTVTWSPPARDRSFTFGPVAAVALVAIVTACALAGWHFRRKEQHLRDQLHAKTRELQSGESLSQLALQDQHSSDSRTQD